MRVRTGYSFKTAVGHLSDVNARLREIEAIAAPITDRDSTFGFRRWRDLCAKEGIKAVYGAEIGVVQTLGEKKPTPNHWTFLAKKALRPLNELIYEATSNPGRDPSLTQAQALGADGVFKMVGERATPEIIANLRGAPDVFLALSPSTPKILVRAAREAGLKMVATSDNYYPDENDLEFYRTALGKRAGTQSYAMHIVSDDEWRKAVEWVASPEEIEFALGIRNGILEECNAELKNATLLKPERPATLRELCERGALRTGTNLNDPVYAERLERELRLIEDKGFEDYFHILSEIVNWSKERMIVGPARGSSCGSLACYLLNITAIDPIPFGLLFERFIDINRGGWKYKKELQSHGPFPPSLETQDD